MRYTTIIDITECPEIYRCLSAKLIYLHLVLKCGWGERNQDYMRCSIRSLEGDLGLTFAAVRHGLSVLEKRGMIKRAPGGYYIRKFCNPTKPGPRPLTRREQAAADARRRQQEEEKLIQAERAAAQAKLEAELQHIEDTRQKWRDGTYKPEDLKKYENIQKILGKK